MEKKNYLLIVLVVILFWIIGINSNLCTNFQSKHYNHMIVVISKDNEKTIRNYQTTANNTRRPT